MTALRYIHLLEQAVAGDGRAVEAAARAAGYTFRACHGTDREGITSFDGGVAGKVQTSDWTEYGSYWLPGWNSAGYYASSAVQRNDAELQRLADAEEAAARAMGTTPMMKSIDRKKIGEENYAKLAEMERAWRLRIDELEASSKGKGKVYNAYLRIENPMIYQYVGMTDPYLGGVAKGRGHDALIIINDTDRGDWREQADEIVVFDPSQIKLADPVTYDDAGNPIPLEKRFDTSNPDIRY